MDPGLIEELKALNLPWLLEGALTSFAGSLVIPGAVLDAICGVGVLVTIAFYWKDLCRVWDQVVAIFQKYIAGPVEDAFNELRDRIEGKDDTTTPPTTLPKDYVIATTAVLSLEKGKYYSAYLDFGTNNVYIGPKITEEVAKVIVSVNNEHFGVFTLSAANAKALVSKLGTPISHDAHGDSGYYKHYHLKLPNNQIGKAHVWYFM